MASKETILRISVTPFIVLKYSEYVFPIESEYSNYYDRAEKYILEAVELGKKLENLDEYISSKIAIAHAALNGKTPYERLREKLVA